MVDYRVTLLLAAKSHKPGLQSTMGRQKAICRTDGGRLNSGWERLLPREQRLFIAHRFSLLYEENMNSRHNSPTSSMYEMIYHEQVEGRPFVKTEASPGMTAVRRITLPYLHNGSTSMTVMSPVPETIKSTSGPPAPTQDVIRRGLDEEVTEVIVFHSPKWADVRRARRYHENKADWQGLFLLRTMRRSDPMIRLY